MVVDEMCGCDMDNWYQLLHPDYDPEVETPVWQCRSCGAIGRGW